VDPGTFDIMMIPILSICTTLLHGRYKPLLDTPPALLLLQSRQTIFSNIYNIERVAYGYIIVLNYGVYLDKFRNIYNTWRLRIL
jgi:hypothetical protein